MGQWVKRVTFWMGHMGMGQCMQWRGERYDGMSTRTGPLESEKKLQTELKDNAKK